MFCFLIKTGVPRKAATHQWRLRVLWLPMPSDIVSTRVRSLDSVPFGKSRITGSAHTAQRGAGPGVRLQLCSCSAEKGRILSLEKTGPSELRGAARDGLPDIGRRMFQYLVATASWVSRLHLRMVAISGANSAAWPGFHDRRCGYHSCCVLPFVGA